MKLPIYINEKINLYDIIFKYTIRDFILGCLRMCPSSIGVALRMIAYKLVMSKNSRGGGVRIAEYVTIKFPENITVGNNVSFNEYDWIDGNGGLEIGNYVSIGPHTSIVTFSHGHNDLSIPIKMQKKELKKVTIEDNVWIGAGVTITCGVRIGTGSIIGAGSVVLKDVEPYSIVAGVPAKVIGKRN